jgi:hypothetical protein
MALIKYVINALILMLIIGVIFNMFLGIKYALEYMLLPDLVPLIWFLVALPTPYYVTIIASPLLS